MIISTAVDFIAYDEPDLSAAGSKGTIAGKTSIHIAVYIFNIFIICIYFLFYLLILIYFLIFKFIISGFGAREVISL